jgi:hypothetical protein
LLRDVLHQRGEQFDTVALHESDSHIANKFTVAHAIVRIGHASDSGGKLVLPPHQYSCDRKSQCRVVMCVAREINAPFPRHVTLQLQMTVIGIEHRLALA